MIQDFESSGLLAMAAKKYRVITFDRPGFGHSERPRATIWTPEAQADLIHAALSKIGISRVIVLGHSWGASVATALALKYPQDVGGLVLASDQQIVDLTSVAGCYVSVAMLLAMAEETTPPGKEAPFKPGEP